VSRFVFLDRDGTLVEDRGYTHRLADYRLLPGVARGLARLRDAGFRLAVVTNQSGIGRGYFSADDYARFQARLVGELADQGIAIEASYHCPHRPEAACDCRKPAPGLLARAAQELGADLARSWMVGDHLGDLELARRAGCAGAVLVRTGRGREQEAEAPADALRADDLQGAAELILASTPPRRGR